MRKVFIPSDEYVKVLGRTIMHEDARQLCTSGSGVEFTYFGSRLEVTLYGDSGVDTSDNYVSWRDIARVRIFVDNLVTLDTTIKNSVEKFLVYGEEANMEPSLHTVRIVKLSEPRMSSVAIGEIAVEIEENTEILPTPNKEKFVEFIGDSITCGYGVDTESEFYLFTTALENVTKAYAYLAATELDVDFSMVSYSGHGFISGYTPDPSTPNKNELIQPYYDVVAYSYNTFRNAAPQNTKWDFKRQPDVIVINIGTNDYSYVQNDPQKTSEFEALYVDFLSQVRRHNANAHIICALGIMGDELYPAVERAVACYSDKNHDENVSTFKFTAQNPELDGLAADYHPSARTHKKASIELIGELKKWL